MTGLPVFKPEGLPFRCRQCLHVSILKDGSRPVLLQGYGAYGIVDEPAYSPAMLATLEHGMWRAVAHVRGGGV